MVNHKISLPADKDSAARCAPLRSGLLSVLTSLGHPHSQTRTLAAYLGQHQRLQSKQIDALNLEKRASKAVLTFLTDSGFENLAEACEDLGLEPLELWNQIMREAGIPEHEMPEMIQVARVY